MKRHDLSDFASKLCAQNMLRYKETHGEDPSMEQTTKMAQISKQLEHKDYERLSLTRDGDEKAFFRQKEGDLLFRNGLSHDTSRDLDRAQARMQKSFENIQRQIEQQRVYEKQMDMSL